MDVFLYRVWMDKFHRTHEVPNSCGSKNMRLLDKAVFLDREDHCVEEVRALTNGEVASFAATRGWGTAAAAEEGLRCRSGVWAPGVLIVGDYDLFKSHIASLSGLKAASADDSIAKLVARCGTLQFLGALTPHAATFEATTFSEASARRTVKQHGDTSGLSNPANEMKRKLIARR